LFFIGLNPSKASAFEDDATLRRLLGFCKSWGYSHLLVMNLFAWISKSPGFLRHCDDPIGKANDRELSAAALTWSECMDWDLWLGWGVGGGLYQRNLAVIALLESYRRIREDQFPKATGLMTIGLTLKGHPRHPLYASSKAVLKPYVWASGRVMSHS